MLSYFLAHVFAMILDSNSYGCSKCVGGTVGSGNTADCDVCPAGTYSSTGTTTCIDCPQNTYASHAGTAKCKSCPSGSINSGVGNTRKTSCANPAFNFVIAFICLGFCVVAINLYIIGGRLTRMSFVRKMRL